jgi:hypothetical protein
MQEITIKCADKIAGELKDREVYFKDLLDRANEGEDKAVEELYENALSVETVKETTVTLSWGGPADYLHIKHHDGEVLGVVYRFSDWFDTATVELDETSPLWDYAVAYIVEDILTA